MEHGHVVEIAVEVEELILESRLRDLALVAKTDRNYRVGAVAEVLSKLNAGAYLIGCGPYSCGVYPLTVDEVVLGRPPSPLEHLPASVPDYTLNDAVWLLPREASRIHATILRRKESGEMKYWVRDENSRTGTYVNGRRVGAGESSAPDEVAVQLSSGDVVALGPSGINSYVFFVAEHPDCASRAD